MGGSVLPLHAISMPKIPPRKGQFLVEAAAFWTNQTAGHFHGSINRQHLTAISKELLTSNGSDDSVWQRMERQAKQPPYSTPDIETVRTAEVMNRAPLGSWRGGGSAQVNHVLHDAQAFKRHNKRYSINHHLKVMLLI